MLSVQQDCYRFVNTSITSYQLFIHLTPPPPPPHPSPVHTVPQKDAQLNLTIRTRKTYVPFFSVLPMAIEHFVINSLFSPQPPPTLHAHT